MKSPHQKPGNKQKGRQEQQLAQQEFIGSGGGYQNSYNDNSSPFAAQGFSARMAPQNFSSKMVAPGNIGNHSNKTGRHTSRQGLLGDQPGDFPTTMGGIFSSTASGLGGVQSMYIGGMFSSGI